MILAGNQFKTCLLMFSFISVFSEKQSLVIQGGLGFRSDLTLPASPIAISPPPEKHLCPRPAYESTNHSGRHTSLNPHTLLIGIWKVCSILRKIYQCCLTIICVSGLLMRNVRPLLLLLQKSCAKTCSSEKTISCKQSGGYFFFLEIHSVFGIINYARWLHWTPG